MKTVLKNSVGFLADLPSLEHVTTSGSLFDFDLIEWMDQDFYGLLFNLSAKDFKYLQYLEEMSFLVSFLRSLKPNAIVKTWTSSKSIKIEPLK